MSNWPGAGRRVGGQRCRRASSSRVWCAPVGSACPRPRRVRPPPCSGQPRGGGPPRRVAAGGRGTGRGRPPRTGLAPGSPFAGGPAVAARDQWHGWADGTRREKLPWVVNHSGFLLRPGVAVPHLASHVLAPARHRLPADWAERYGDRPVLVETLVATGRFAGTCYQAANWQGIGMTGGRGRPDRAPAAAGPRQQVWVDPPISRSRTSTRRWRDLRVYTARWGIAGYHRVLQRGGKTERRQLGVAHRLAACLAIDLLVAWRIFHLTIPRRETPTVPGTVYFEEHEWQALVADVPRRAAVPATPPSRREAVRMVAGRGGFLGRTGDGEPGTQTMWLGLPRHDDRAAPYQCCDPPPGPPPRCSATGLMGKDQTRTGWSGEEIFEGDELLVLPTRVGMVRGRHRRCSRHRNSAPLARRSSGCGTVPRGCRRSRCPVTHYKIPARCKRAGCRLPGSMTTPHPSSPSSILKPSCCRGRSRVAPVRTTPRHWPAVAESSEHPRPRSWTRRAPRSGWRTALRTGGPATMTPIPAP